MTKPKVAADLLKKFLPLDTRNEFITSLSHNLGITEAFILDVGTRVTKNFINDWLRDARDVCEEGRDLLDEFDYRSSTSSSFIDRLVIDVEFHRRSQVVNGKLEETCENASRFPLTAWSVPSNIDDRERNCLSDRYEVYGQDKEIADLMYMLLHPTNENHVISVLGMGGIGKTTLAQRIFKDCETSDHFEAKGWVSVSQYSSTAEVVKIIIISLTGKYTNVDDGLDTPVLHLRSIVEGKRFLLVLDDVRAVDPWWAPIRDCFAYAAKGSRILITTRDEKVARTTDTTQPIHLKGLSTEACWRLFSDRALHISSPEDLRGLKKGSFESLGRDIVAKCNGIPLAVRIVGDLLRDKVDLQEWEKVLHAMPDLQECESDLDHVRATKDSEIFVAEERVFPVLKLSYNQLGTISKRCLAYCRIFPKDHSIDKDTLVKLWMAQGYLGSSPNEKNMEDTGYGILQELKARSFFQDPDHGINNKAFKIHGLLHDFLPTFLEMEYVTSKVDRGTGLYCKFSHPEKARHSTLVIAAQSSLPVSVCKLKKLRTLVILSDYAFVSTGCLRQLFEHLRLLRALHFSCCSIEKIPSQLGKLNQLRYMNLSYNRNLKELPETLCDLYNLQTLNLNGCDQLVKLPEGIGKLTNLRHLEILWTLSLSFLPKGIGKLSSLRTLNRFVVSPSSGNKACKLGELEKLEELEGYLYIDGLADLASADEARRASLHSKEGLCGLDLWFSGVGTNKESMQNVLEALQPPRDLQYLGIHYYGGTVLPTWMESLTKLRELILFNCTNCESFLCVATLPSLESLEIRDMPNVKELSFDVNVDVSGETAFPQLISLCIYNMKQLNNWKVTVGGAAASTCPCLLRLSIGNCPELQALLHLLQAPKLEELSISECPKLSEWLNTAENQEKIHNIPNIKIDGQDMQKTGRRSSHLASSSSSVSRTFTSVRSSLGQ